eukprot:COSAG02_NODE_90_length_37755_cov_29.833364_7_plen_59_part_00
MTGDEISPSKDFLQKQNGSFLAGECPLYVVHTYMRSFVHPPRPKNHIVNLSWPWLAGL